jgi:hypothetical protein
MTAPAPPQPAFTALFNNISKDPFDGIYSPLFAPFNISLTNANPTLNNVCQQIAAVSNQRSPLANVLLDNGLTHVYGLPFRCDQAVGVAPVSALDGKYFVFDGEPVLSQGVLVEIPAQWFNMTAQVQVPTLDNIRVQLAANASPTLTFGPYVGGDPDTVAIKTWAAIVLPHKYVGLFLAQPDGIPPPPSWRLMVPREHALPSPSTVKWPSPSLLGGSPPCRLFPLSHLHVMSPS